MKINIIRRDVLKYRRVQVIRRVNALVTFGSIGLFSLAIVYMTSYFVYLGFRQNSLTQTAKELQQGYNGRVREVAAYTAVKEIASAVNVLEAKRFRYKEFLNGIYALLPPAAILTAVDFGAPGVVVAGVRLANLNDYDFLINNVKNASGSANFLFSAIASKQLIRELTGSYLVRLELKIKNGS
ncbi:MAG: hypothetical protein AAB973_04305 [Patescibacteria group bacterium]